MSRNTRPTASGVYQAMLEANLHLCSRADLEEAERLKALLPAFPEGAQMQRRSLQMIGQQLVMKGVRQIIDFGSGFPTDDHIHSQVPSEILIVYSDHDEPTVVEANKILRKKRLKNVFYVLGDAGNPETVAEHPAVRQRLNRYEPVGIVFWGLSVFLPDDKIKQAMEYLYWWASPGSWLVFQAQFPELDLDDERMRAIMGIYEHVIGQRLHIRSIDRYCELLGRWGVAPEQFKRVSELLKEPSRLWSMEMQEFYRSGGVGCGVFVERGTEMLAEEPVESFSDGANVSLHEVAAPSRNQTKGETVGAVSNVNESNPQVAATFIDKCTILLLAANPVTTMPLALDEECREIERKIREADYRDCLHLVSKWAVRPDDLLQYLNEHRPHIVHFSGHGSSSEEIVFQDAGRKPRPVTKEALKQLFATLKDNIRLVLLNACFSRSQAEAITQVIDCAIGMKRAISDRGAIVFAASFYRALGFGRSLLEAFEQGKVALMLEGNSDENSVELLCRDGVDPRKIVFVTP